MAEACAGAVVGRLEVAPAVPVLAAALLPLPGNCATIFNRS